MRADLCCPQSGRKITHTGGQAASSLSAMVSRAITPLPMSSICRSVGREKSTKQCSAGVGVGTRISARTCARIFAEPRILILDEATSALDAESEEIIQANLKAIATGRAVIIVAHRLSAVRSADRIIAIESELITEAGTHQELPHKGGRYADLYNR